MFAIVWIQNKQKGEVLRISQNFKKCNQIFHQENSQNTNTQQHMCGSVTWPDLDQLENEHGNWATEFVFE